MNWLFTGAAGEKCFHSVRHSEECAMARKKEGDGSELITHLSSIVSELLPLFLEKWADLNDRPRIEEMNARLGSLRNGIQRQNGRIRNLTILSVFLIVWNIFLSVLLFIVWQG